MVWRRSLKKSSVNEATSCISSQRRQRNWTA
ncbi:hypothetical protein CCH79_00006268 [Gambusia affinis]|uniref:Uncharacterized protein n=1 Tax=Gambusia affinis TaxID=33528 RepID=A0A315WAZ4_GAMAF|nr:hypothetical protein CCH79_00006268 [Gambusia affinis]